jgi:hypothetical protein
MTRTCPNCGAPLVEDAVFCEQCGTAIDPDVSQTAQRATTGRRRLKLVLTAVGVVCLVGVGGYFAGSETADDSDRVAKLERQVEDLTDQRDEERSRAATAETDAEELRDEVTRLQDRLDAELGLRGEGESRPPAAGSVDADLELGQAGTVGDLILKPTAFVEANSTGDTTSYVATITAKNDGDEPVGPFCGGTGAELEDSAGRTFDGDSVLADGTRNCGDDLQPGLSADNYKMKFTLPSDAVPALLRLYDEFDESVSKTWAVGR